MVAGDLVNTASRVQSAAEPGTVLVGESTRRADGGGDRVRGGRSLELKGKTEPRPALAGAAHRLGRREARAKSTGLEAPFVGRDASYASRKDVFHATSAEEGVPTSSRSIGVAGIGKSRLAWEF